VPFGRISKVKPFESRYARSAGGRRSATARINISGDAIEVSTRFELKGQVVFDPDVIGWPWGLKPQVVVSPDSGEPLELGARHRRPGGFVRSPIDLDRGLFVPRLLTICSNLLTHGIFLLSTSLNASGETCDSDVGFLPPGIT
jgi:hypothetical protein